MNANLVVVWPIYTPGPPDWALEPAPREGDPAPRVKQVKRYERRAVIEPVLKRLLQQPRTLLELVALSPFTASQIQNWLARWRLSGQVRSTRRRAFGQRAFYEWVKEGTR